MELNSLCVGSDGWVSNKQVDSAAWKDLGSVSNEKAALRKRGSVKKKCDNQNTKDKQWERKLTCR
jgi:hypothetical protein